MASFLFLSVLSALLRQHLLLVTHLERLFVCLHEACQLVKKLPWVPCVKLYGGCYPLGRSIHPWTNVLLIAVDDQPLAVVAKDRRSIGMGQRFVLQDVMPARVPGVVKSSIARRADPPFCLGRMHVQVPHSRFAWATRQVGCFFLFRNRLCVFIAPISRLLDDDPFALNGRTCAPASTNPDNPPRFASFPAAQ